MVDNDNTSTCPFCNHSLSLLSYNGDGACEHLIYVDWDATDWSPYSHNDDSDDWTYPDLEVVFDAPLDHEDDDDFDSLREWLTDRVRGYIRDECRQPTTPVRNVMAHWLDHSDEDEVDPEWSCTTLALYTADRAALIDELREYGLYRRQPRIEKT